MHSFAIFFKSHELFALIKAITQNNEAIILGHKAFNISDSTTLNFLSLDLELVLFLTSGLTLVSNLLSIKKLFKHFI